MYVQNPLNVHAFVIKCPHTFGPLVYVQISKKQYLVLCLRLRKPVDFHVASHASQKRCDWLQTPENVAGLEPLEPETH